MNNMDASASEVGPIIKNIYDLFVNVDESTYTPTVQRHTVIKYTKIPECDTVSSVIWQRKNENLQPRMRRIVTVNNNYVRTTQSLKSENLYSNPKFSPSTTTRRKIATIEEDKEVPLFHTNYGTRPENNKVSNRAVSTNNICKVEKSARNRSRLSNINSRETSIGTKFDLNKRDSKMSHNKINNANIVGHSFVDINKTRIGKGKDIVRINSKSRKINNIIEKQSEAALIQNEMLKILSPVGKQKTNVIQSNKHSSNKMKIANVAKEINNNNKKVKLIHVPLQLYSEKKSDNKVNKECGTQIDIFLNSSHVNIGTDVKPETLNRDTETEKEYFDIQSSQIETKNANIETNITCNCIDIITPDNLCIPNVKLTSEKSTETFGDNTKAISNMSLPNLEMPLLQVSRNDSESSVFANNHSYIIGRATVTYTTKQKIDFQVLGNNINNSIPLSKCPLNVVSVLKKEISRHKRDVTQTMSDNIIPKQVYTASFNEQSETQLPVNCLFSHFSNDTLVKPSEIINTIAQGNGLFDDNVISEQFQKELSFIDSFIESLQYLESCSLSKKSDYDKPYDWYYQKGFELDRTDYNTLLSNNNISDNETEVQTKASKSLCLLNFLIHDEQKRAKDLLFVLKMREDALKDFTKSQLLWLENKKKLEHTDISTLKKKQRGALLKLQQECGEMQRMRKALLALSEKRKAALIKTKRSIELLKLSDSIDVDKIWCQSKRKLRKTPSLDRSLAPLKCFDLTASSCEEKTTSQPCDLSEEGNTIACSAEKSVQTGESILVDHGIGTAAENFVVVEGKYLNILFHNLTLPQIFCDCKQYEVNEEALRNILNSSNTVRSSISDSNVIKNFMEQLKSNDGLSTPSTARSLVEEFDQYYKNLGDLEDSNNGSLSDRDYEQFDIGPNNVEINNDNVKEVLEETIETVESNNNDKLIEASTEELNSLQHLVIANIVSNREDQFTCVDSTYSTSQELSTTLLELNNTCNIELAPNLEELITDVEPSMDYDISIMPPMKCGFLQEHESDPTDDVVNPVASKKSSDSTLTMSDSSSPAVCEAEELRRQQLAIEQEIKALEQQQSQLLVVREIPDKPPPPYTPPTETRRTKTSRRFVSDDILETKVQQYLQGCTTANPHGDTEDSYDEFIKDYCAESIERRHCHPSDKPWDAFNLLPKQSEIDQENIHKQTTEDLRDVLTGTAPSGVVAALGNRRSDHIDDILFQEWCRCEPEWTSLQTDEAIVKNQVFEGIFQKLLSETVDEYKKTVFNKSDSD